MGHEASEDQLEAWRDVAREYVAIELRDGSVDLADREATRQLHDQLAQLQPARQSSKISGPMIQRRLKGFGLIHSRRRTFG